MISQNPTVHQEAVCSSEMSVAFQWTTRRYIPENSTVRNHRCVNLKSYICCILLADMYLISPVDCFGIFCEGLFMFSETRNSLYIDYSVTIQDVGSAFCWLLAWLTV
jgi:hypothetical protein